MANDWVEQRFKRHQNNIDERRRKLHWAENAKASYNKFFGLLQERVEADVQKYNTLFSGLEGCGAVFNRVQDGFRVQRGEAYVTAEKSNGTVISIAMFRNPAMPRFHTLEVAADAQGNIGLKQGDKFLEVCDASEAVLSDLLCE